MIEEADRDESRQESELVMPREVMGFAHEHEELWAAIGTSMRDESARVQENNGDYKWKMSYSQANNL